MPCAVESSLTVAFLNKGLCCVLGGSNAKKSKERKLEKEERRDGSLTTASCEYIEYIVERFSNDWRIDWTSFSVYLISKIARNTVNFHI